jgi:hypothetical protein
MGCTLLKQCAAACLLFRCILDYDELNAFAAVFAYLLCIEDAASYYRMVFGTVSADTVEHVVKRVKADAPSVTFVRPGAAERLAYGSWRDETRDADLSSASLPLCNVRLDVVVLCEDEETRVAYKALRRNAEDAYDPSVRTVWGLRSFGKYVTARTGRGRVPAQFSPLLFCALAALLLDWPFRRWVSARVCARARMTVVKKIGSSSRGTLQG